jgi:hypothetical protein
MRAHPSRARRWARRLAPLAIAGASFGSLAVVATATPANAVTYTRFESPDGGGTVADFGNGNYTYYFDTGLVVIYNNYRAVARYYQ